MLSKNPKIGYEDYGKQARIINLENDLQKYMAIQKVDEKELKYFDWFIQSMDDRKARVTAKNEKEDKFYKLRSHPQRSRKQQMHNLDEYASKIDKIFHRGRKQMLDFEVKKLKLKHVLFQNTKFLYQIKADALSKNEDLVTKRENELKEIVSKPKKLEKIINSKEEQMKNLNEISNLKNKNFEKQIQGHEIMNLSLQKQNEAEEKKLKDKNENMMQLDADLSSKMVEHQDNVAKLDEMCKKFDQTKKEDNDKLSKFAEQQESLTTQTKNLDKTENQLQMLLENAKTLDKETNLKHKFVAEKDGKIKKTINLRERNEMSHEVEKLKFARDQKEHEENLEKHNVLAQTLADAQAQLEVDKIDVANQAEKNAATKEKLQQSKANLEEHVQNLNNIQTMLLDSHSHLTGHNDAFKQAKEDHVKNVNAHKENVKEHEENIKAHEEIVKQFQQTNLDDDSDSKIQPKPEDVKEHIENFETHKESVAALNESIKIHEENKKVHEENVKQHKENVQQFQEKKQVVAQSIRDQHEQLQKHCDTLNEHQNKLKETHAQLTTHNESIKQLKESHTNDVKQHEENIKQHKENVKALEVEKKLHNASIKATVVIN